MLVRIRWPLGKPPRPRRDAGLRAAWALAALLAPASLVLILLGAWILAAEFRFTERFPVREGLLSHWQFWLAAAAAARVAAWRLERHRGPSDR